MSFIVVSVIVKNLNSQTLQIDTIKSKPDSNSDSLQKAKTGITISEDNKAKTKISNIDSISKNRDSTKVTYFYSNFEKLGKLALIQNDTALDGFQNYDLLNKNDRFFATLGNIGQNYRSLLPFSVSTKSGFDYGIHTFDEYLYKNDSIKYYKVFKTYTELSYVQGAKKEQNFRAVFSRNIYRSLNLGFNFHVASAPGAYTRQKTNHINFALTTQFFTKNKRYGVIANFTINRLRNYENGGLKSDSLFKNDIETNRLIIPVNLGYAETKIKETGFFMKHYFDITKHQQSIKDTTPDDSPNFDLGRLSYSFQYNRQIQIFTDTYADSTFFPPPILDSLTTYDSVSIKQVTNTLLWSNPSFKTGMQPRIFQIEAGIRQTYSVVDLHGTRNSFLQFIPTAGISLTPIESLKLTANGDYVFGDYNEGDFHLVAKLLSILGKQNRNGGIISITGALSSQQPGWFYSNYQGNYSKWDTTWRKTGIISAGFSYSYKYFETGINVSRITNFIYLDSSCQPQQFTQQFGFLKIFFNTNLDLWRFKLNARLIYQSVQGTTVLRLPVFMGNVSLYFSQPLFHGAAVFQPGLNFFYNTSYYAENYNPAIRSFYLQDKTEIGNYLYMDVFINLKIQRARLFATYTHFNAGFMDRNYYMTPGYPMPDGAFKFGVSWRFHD
jgi:hypothetical protein